MAREEGRMSAQNFQSIPRLDKSFLEDLRMLESNPPDGIVDEILNIFFEIAPKMVAELKTALDHSNLIEINRKAHSLKSSAGNLGATRMAEVCLQLERSTDLEQMRALVSVLTEECSALMIELKNELTQKA